MMESGMKFKKGKRSEKGINHSLTVIRKFNVIEISSLAEKDFLNAHVQHTKQSQGG